MGVQSFGFANIPRMGSPRAQHTYLLTAGKRKFRKFQYKYKSLGVVSPQGDRNFKRHLLEFGGV